MRKPKQRNRKAVINDKLVELFRAALPAYERLSNHPRGTMNAAETAAVHETIYAFQKAVGYVPWESRNDPLRKDAVGDGAELRAALLAEIKRQDSQGEV